MIYRIFNALLLATTTVFNLWADQPPNILFIMSDDHTWQGVGAYGSRFSYLNPTPNIDSLAKEGMVFKNAMVGNAICTPSRASIMTGQYSHMNGVLTLNGRLPHERQHLAHEIKKAGYQTAIIGKWHLHTRPTAFDHYKVLPGQGKYFNPSFFEKGKKGKVNMQGHSTDCITDSTLEWLKEKRNPQQPFFLKLHYKAPHDYFENAPRYDDYLKEIQMPEPQSLWNRGMGSLGTRGHRGELESIIGTSIGRRNYRRNYSIDFEVDPNSGEKEAKREAYNVYMKRYFRCIKGVDDNIGRILDYLEDNGLRDNTLIVYTSDQGFFLGEHDMQDKRWAYEPSLRTPLIVSYPNNIPQNSVSDAIIENIDHPAMILDYAGVQRPDYMQGRSFRKILESGHEPVGWKQEGYYQYWMHMAHHDIPAHIAMRTKRYKLIQFYGTAGHRGFGNKRSSKPTPPSWELYDLERDPHEMVNLYDNPEHSKLVLSLKQRFAKLRQRIGADDLNRIVDAEVQKRMRSVNTVIDEFWDYSDEDREKAVGISRSLHQTFSDPSSTKTHLPPWLKKKS